VSRFSVTALQLQGLVRMHRQRIGDARGFLSRLFYTDKIGNTAWHMDSSALLIMKGFAHGLQTLMDDADSSTATRLTMRPRRRAASTRAMCAWASTGRWKSLKCRCAMPRIPCLTLNSKA